MDSSQFLEGLDEDQRAVAESLGMPVSVIAGAGTGKTRTITHRLGYAATEGAIDPRATLAVTFTTSAALEVRQRLEAMGVRGVQSRTFHSAALRQAQYFWPEVYRSTLPRVEDNRDMLISEACKRLGISPSKQVLSEVSSEISWTKQSNVLAEDYVDLARDHHRTVLHLDLDTVADLIVAYEEAKQAHCVIDLDDLLLCTVALLSTQADVSKKVQATYRHFVFDEYQDLSPVQARLVDLWVGRRQDLCVVGDPAQTIHSFAGSTSVYLERFADSHAHSQSLELTRNYRSTPEILAKANAVTTTGLQLRAQRSTGTTVEFHAGGDPLEESTEVAQWLKGLHRDGIAWEEMALLFRTNAQAEAIRQILADEQVPFLALKSENSHSRPGVRLGTLHGSKGLEWEAVGLCGLHDGSLPHPCANSHDRLQEERRLLYVGITRARSFLRISWPSSMDGRPTSPSRFLAGILG
ncbi:MAG: ATP-dependent helicase [Propionibacteriaceae bacterium]|nr:ATP-dependent helicase [Propionibacteriaceae bacterium]